MVRPLRQTHAGAYYHVNTRGNNKCAVYVDALDRYAFLELLAEKQKKYEWVIYAWVLMTNHYHLVLRVPRDGLSAGMCELNGGYARRSNRRHGRCDHVFGKRFGSKEIVTESHLLEACRYVVLNPVRAGLCRHPSEWPWSSYHACAGLREPEQFLARDELLDLFREIFGTPEAKRLDAYREFVLARLDETWLLPPRGARHR